METENFIRQVVAIAILVAVSNLEANECETQCIGNENKKNGRWVAEAYNEAIATQRPISTINIRKRLLNIALQMSPSRNGIFQNMDFLEVA